MDDDLGYLDNEDYSLPQREPPQKRRRGSNRSNHSLPKNEDLDFFEDIQDNDKYKSKAEKKLELPKINNKNPIPIPTTNRTKKIDEYAELEEIPQQKNNFQKQRSISKQENLDFEDNYNDTQTLQNTLKSSKKKDKKTQSIERPHKKQEQEEYQNLKQPQFPKQKSVQNIKSTNYNIENEEDQQYEQYDEENKEKEEEYEQQFDDEYNDDFENDDQQRFKSDQQVEQPKQLNQNKSTISDQQINNKSKVNNKPTLGQGKSQFRQKYQAILGQKDLNEYNEKIIMKENEQLRAALKELSADINKHIEKAQLKQHSNPNHNGFRNKNLEEKIKELEVEFQKNEKTLEQQQIEIQKVTQRYEQVASPFYIQDLKNEINKLKKLIEETNKNNKKAFQNNNKKAKDLEQNENADGGPEYIKEYNQKKQESEILKRKNKQYLENLDRINEEIQLINEKLNEDINQRLQEKVKEALNLNIELDQQTQLSNLKARYDKALKQKQNLEKFNELIKKKDSQIQSGYRDIENIHKQINQKNEEINKKEMEVIAQKNQIDKLEEHLQTLLPQKELKKITDRMRHNQNQIVLENPTEYDEAVKNGSPLPDKRDRKQITSAKPKMKPTSEQNSLKCLSVDKQKTFDIERNPKNNDKELGQINKSKSKPNLKMQKPPQPIEEEQEQSKQSISETVQQQPTAQQTNQQTIQEQIQPEPVVEKIEVKEEPKPTTKPLFNFKLKQQQSLQQDVKSENIEQQINQQQIQQNNPIITPQPLSSANQSNQNTVYSNENQNQEDNNFPQRRPLRMLRKTEEQSNQGYVISQPTKPQQQFAQNVPIVKEQETNIVNNKEQIVLNSQRSNNYQEEPQKVVNLFQKKEEIKINTEEKPIEKQPSNQAQPVQKIQAAPKRDRGGPRKLNIDEDEPPVDFNNIKTLEPSNQVYKEPENVKPIEVKKNFQIPVDNYDYEEPKPVIKQQKKQTAQERQRELLEKAGKGNDLFDDLDI